MTSVIALQNISRVLDLLILVNNKEKQFHLPIIFPEILHNPYTHCTLINNLLYSRFWSLYWKISWTLPVIIAFRKGQASDLSDL